MRVTQHMGNQFIRVKLVDGGVDADMEAEHRQGARLGWQHRIWDRCRVLTVREFTDVTDLVRLVLRVLKMAVIFDRFLEQLAK